jgi:hypothetical protein
MPYAQKYDPRFLMLIPTEIIEKYDIKYDDDGFNIKSYESICDSSSNSRSSRESADESSNSHEMSGSNSSDGGQISAGNSIEHGRSFEDGVSGRSVGDS